MIAPSATPQIEPMPPKITSTRTLTETWKVKRDGMMIADQPGGHDSPETAARRANGEGHDLVLEGIDADGLGRHFVLSNRDPRPTHARMLQRREDDEEDHDEDETEVVVRRRIVAPTRSDRTEMQRRVGNRARAQHRHR